MIDKKSLLLGMSMSGGGSEDWTSELRSCHEMFKGNITLAEAPQLDTSNVTTMDYMFSGCSALATVPKYDASNVTTLAYMFDNCHLLKSVPQFSNTSTVGTFNGMLNNCEQVKGNVTLDISSGENYVSMFGCNSVSVICGSEIETVIFKGNNTKQLNSNKFSGTFAGQRLKHLLFDCNQPFSWKSQTIDLSSLDYAYFTGRSESWSEKYAFEYAAKVLEKHPTFRLDKMIYNAATYATLKDDPERWYFTGASNARYYTNYTKTSAVETINSLPDTSAYLATAGGTNTIKFDGKAGTSMDEGAINTMTADEIAVAAAKGWTVSFV